MEHKMALEDAKELFGLFDPKNTGFVSSEELGALLRGSGKCVSQQELCDVLNKCDVDESGLIAFEEFFRVLQTESLPEEMPLEQLAGAFAVFDPENTGFVSAAVFRSVLELKGEPLNQEDIDALMKECEINGDGQISIRAFIDHMVATSRPTPPPLRYAPVE